MSDATHIRPRVALISMPWVSAWMPSIQLAILRQCLGDGAQVDTHELYVDYAVRISERLYRPLSEAGGLIEEWLFAKHYFEQEGLPMEDGFLDDFPSFGLDSRELERKVIETLVDVTGDFLDDVIAETDWSSYDVVAFSVSLYQTTASFALARLIKRSNPQVRVVFGGNSCVGTAASAMMRICPYVDVVVRTEAEPVFARLVESLIRAQDLRDLPGVTFRDSATQGIVETAPGPLHRLDGVLATPNYDAYFERVHRRGLDRQDLIWLPFESSRGCWWGEKSQCVFCGLHDIMQYRAKEPAAVLDELTAHHARYGITRFFSTDLIMPQSYYRTLLPALAAHDPKFEIFYELKGNVTRDMMASLRDAGVTRLQPGLESLSTATLKRMKKGITACQVVQFLKWAREFNLDVGWNIIVGIPGEDSTDLEASAALASRLVHLDAPHFIQFELDKFSPIFEDPSAFGISNVRPLYAYKYVYPLPQDLLRDLVYRFEYDVEDFQGTPPWLDPASTLDYASALNSSVESWRNARTNGAFLVYTVEDDGCLVIVDGRTHDSEPATVRFSRSAALLYSYLDCARSRTAVATGFQRLHEHAFVDLGGHDGVEALLHLWDAQRLTCEEAGSVVALAVRRATPWPGPVSHDAEGVHAHTDSAAWIATHNDGARDTSELVKRLQVRGMIADGPLSLSQQSSTRPAVLIEDRHGRRVFAKYVSEDGARREAVLQHYLSTDCLTTAAGLIPRAIAILPEQTIVAHEALSSRASWHDLLTSGNGFDEAIAYNVGRATGRLHAQAIPPQFRVDLGVAAAPLRDYSSPQIDAVAQGPGFDFMEFLQQAQTVSDIINTLRCDWRPTHLIHGDLKTDHVLLGSAENDIAFIDWEGVALGPAWFDLGTLIGSVLAGWLTQIDFAVSVTVEEALGRSRTRTATLARTIDALLQGYAMAGSAARTNAADVWRTAGVFLLERGYTALALNGRLSCAARLSMALGTAVIRQPLAAVSALSMQSDAAPTH